MVDNNSIGEIREPTFWERFRAHPLTTFSDAQGFRNAWAALQANAGPTVAADTARIQGFNVSHGAGSSWEAPRARAQRVIDNTAGGTTTPTASLNGVPPLVARPAPGLQDRVFGLSQAEDKTWQASNPAGLLAGQQKPGDLSDEGRRLLARAQENLTARGTPQTSSVGTGAPAMVSGPYGALPAGEPGSIVARDRERAVAFGRGALPMSTE